MEEGREYGGKEGRRVEREERTEERPRDKEREGKGGMVEGDRKERKRESGRKVARRGTLER